MGTRQLNTYIHWFDEGYQHDYSTPQPIKVQFRFLEVIHGITTNIYVLALTKTNSQK